MAKTPVEIVYLIRERERDHFVVECSYFTIARVY